VTAGVNNGYLYVSTNAGATFVDTGIGGLCWSVAMSGDGKRQVCVMKQGVVYVSNDYGATWTATATSGNWQHAAVSGDGAYQLVTGSGLNMWANRARPRVRGDLTVDCSLKFGALGRLMVFGGTQLVFVAGSVTNVLDSNILAP
jgi:hypothetical protein